MTGARSFPALLVRALGLILCCVPSALCILFYFPLWRSEGAASLISGFTVLLLALSFLPFYKSVKRLLRSASIYTLWLIAFLLFFCLSRIADEMTVICFVGFIGNLLGALCFRWARQIGAGLRRDNNE